MEKREKQVIDIIKCGSINGYKIEWDVRGRTHSDYTILENAL